MSEDPPGLAALKARLRDDLACLNYPPANWVPPRRHGGGAVTDVVLIGGGMCGLAAAFALLRLGVRNLRLLDRSAAGREGPWITYARMERLRSPKHLTGPAADLPALTFRAWYEAQFGAGAWERLGKIPRPLWMDYLRWYRAVLDLPVENGVEVTRIEPAADGLLRLTLRGAGEPAVIARKVVLATGREGLGGPYVPDFVRTLPRARWAHAAEAIEAGAAEVRLLIRRRAMPRINKLMGIGTPGFTHGFPALSDLWRWRFMHYAHAAQTPPPRESTLRVSRHPNASFHFGCAVRSMALAGDAVRIETASGKRFETDFVILGTGFTVDLHARPELAGLAGAIAVWADRFTPPAELASEELAGFPYLAPDFAFTAREPGTAPWLADIHCFNHAASLSLGKISGDIPAVSEGAALLARAIASAFYRADVERHYRDLLAYAKPELLGDEWTDAEAPSAAD